MQPIISHIITATYDGLQRVVAVVESPGSSYAYTYDLSGNRTSETINGVMPERDYNDAHQVDD